MVSKCVYFFCSCPTHQPIVASDQLADLERKLDSRIVKLEKDLSTKIDEKLSAILNKLEQSPQSPATTASSNGYRGRGRGNRGNRYTTNSNSLNG